MPTLRPAGAAEAAIAWSWTPVYDDLRRWAGSTVRNPATPLSLWEDINNADATSFGLFDADGRLLGFGQVRFRERRFGHLARIIVDPKRRGQGSGRLLCQLLMREARQLHPSIEAFTLYVYRDNANAIGLYESLGYRDRGSHPKYPEVNLMLAPLEASP